MEDPKEFQRIWKHFSSEKSWQRCLDQTRHFYSMSWGPMLAADFQFLSKTVSRCTKLAGVKHPVNPV